MKIGQVCPYHMFKGGGVQECVNELYTELSKRGHEVKIITPLPRDYDGLVPDHMITIGTSANVRAFFSTQTQFSAAVDTEAVDEMLEREKFDVLHFHEPWVPVVSRQIISRSNAVNVATLHARLPDKLTSKTIANIFRPYVKAVMSHIDAYTAVSEAAMEHIGAITTDPITIIPNGINIKKYKNHSYSKKHSSKKSILYIGRLEKRKGVRYLIDAFSQLSERHNDVQLLIAGVGPEEENLRLLVDEYDVERVKFLGYISEQEKLELLHSCDLFCSPARYGESFGIVLLEAMASGLPVVAGDNPGYEAVMQGTGNVSLVDVKSTGDFARRLDLMLYDDTLRNVWKEWAEQYIQQYDYPKIVDKYESLYLELMAKHEHNSKT